MILACRSCEKEMYVEDPSLKQCPRCGSSDILIFSLKKKKRDREDKKLILRGIFGIVAIMGVVFIIVGILYVGSPLGATLLVIGVIICGIGIGVATGKDFGCCTLCP